MSTPTITPQDRSILHRAGLASYRPMGDWQLGSMAGRVWHEDDDPMPDERYPHELRDY